MYINKNMYNNEIVELAKQLKGSGKNISEISRQLGVSRSVILDWLTKKTKNTKNSKNDLFDNFINSLETDEIFKYNYYYLLGQYLGDGYINKLGRTYNLRIAACAKHTNIINEIINSLTIIFPSNKIQQVKSQGCVNIGIYNNSLPTIFPHLGVGEKHNRKLELSDWQLKNIHHSALLRGLIHSDGSSYYSNNRLNYTFYNCSLDIINICSNCLNNNNICYKLYTKTVDKKTKHLQKVITICRRSEVEKMFNICGIKS